MPAKKEIVLCVARTAYLARKLYYKQYSSMSALVLG